MADTFTFVVNLTDRNGNPMIGVDVECVDINLFTVEAPDPMHYIVAVGQTDISGTVTFAGLPPSQYFARPRITHREDMRIQVQTPPGMGGGGKMCYAALVEQHGLGTHTTIQSAIDAVGTGGGVVFICGGTYIEDLVIAVDTKHLWLIGASRGQCVIVGRLVTNAVLNHGISDFRMEHLTLDGKAGTALLFHYAAGAIPWTIVLSDLTITHAGTGIDMSEGASDVTIANVDMHATVINAGQFEVLALDISDCRWLVSGNGPYIGGGMAIHDTKISNCGFWGGNSYAMRILRTNKIIVTGCKFTTTGTGTCGIKIGAIVNCKISDSTIDVIEGKGIDASGAMLGPLTLSNIQLVCAHPQVTDRIGIDISSNVRELIINGCHIKNFESHGIQLGAMQRFIISNTIIINGGDCDSIHLNGPDYGLIIGCYLQGTGGANTTYGIYGHLGGATTWTSITGNVAYLHDDITNLVTDVDNNIVGGNNPTGGGGVAFHDPVTLDANADTLLSLAVQELGLDLQAANLMFSGPAAGEPAIPTFRSLADLDIPAAIMRDAEHTAIGDNLPHHPAVTLGAGDPALSLAAGQVLTLADVLTPAEHTAIGDAAPHHPAITLDAGSAAELTLAAGQVLKLAEVLSTAEHLAIGDAAPHHAPVTLGAGSDAALALAGQELTLADVLTPAEHTAIGGAAPHHAAVTLGGGSDPALALAGQQLTLADVLTPAEHTAIGDAAPHHAAVTLHAGLDANLLALAGQQLDLDTQAANKLFAGPAAGADAKPAFRSQVAADLPAEAIVDADIAAAEGFLRKTGAGAYMAHKSNLASAANPGVNDDLAHGYTVGSVWINTTLDVVWQCVDSTDGAAVWKDLSTQGAGGGATFIADTDADTKVQTEAAPDEDKIRFTTAAVERAVLDNVALDLTVPIKVDTITEHTAAAGVTIEGVSHLDSFIELFNIAEPPNATGVRLFCKEVALQPQLWIKRGAAAAEMVGFGIVQDADADTQIQLQKVANENKIRMDVAGTERFVLQNVTPHLTLTGDVAITGWVTVYGPNGALVVPAMTTAQRDALTLVNGSLIYNTSNARCEKLENGIWYPMGGDLEGVFVRSRGQWGDWEPASAAYLDGNGLFAGFTRSAASASLNLDASGKYYLGTTAATTNTISSIQGVDVPVTRRAFKPALLAKFKLSSFANMRYFVGLSDQTAATMGAADDPAGNYVGLQFSTARGDTKWMMVTKDGTTQNRFNTQITPVADTVYYMRITAAVVPPHDVVRVELLDASFLQIANRVFNSAQHPLPGADANLYADVVLTTLANAAKSLYFYFGRMASTTV